MQANAAQHEVHGSHVGEARSARGGAMCDWLVRRRPELTLLFPLFVSLANFGVPVMGARVRLTELSVALMIALYWRRARMGLETAPWRVPPTVWIMAGGYLIVSALCAWGKGLGGLRFEIEALIVFLFALRWGHRLSGKLWLGAVACAVAMAGFAALALAARGLRGVWFFAPDASFRAIGFAEGDPASSGVFQLGGAFGHKNFLAAFFVMTLPVLFAGLTDGAIGRRQKHWTAVALMGGAGVLLVTDALFGIAAAVVSVGLVIAFLSVGARSNAAPTERPASSARQAWKMAAGAILVAALVVIGVFGSGRIAALAGKGGGGSLAARAYLWEEGWRLVGGHPWSGIGRETFGRLVDGGFPHAHNLYLMKYLESGVIGGTLFACLLLLCVGAAIRASRRAPSRVLVGVAAGFLGVAVYCLTDYFYNEPPLMILFWLWAGLAAGQRMGRQRHHNK